MPTRRIWTCRVVLIGLLLGALVAPTKAAEEYFHVRADCRIVPTSFNPALGSTPSSCKGAATSGEGERNCLVPLGSDALPAGHVPRVERRCTGDHRGHGFLVGRLLRRSGTSRVRPAPARRDHVRGRGHGRRGCRGRSGVRCTGGTRTSALDDLPRHGSGVPVRIPQGRFGGVQDRPASPVLQWHEKVAGHTASPSVNMGQFVAQEILSGELTLAEAFSKDGIHPTPRGHALYAEAVKPLFAHSDTCPVSFQVNILRLTSNSLDVGDVNQILAGGAWIRAKLPDSSPAGD